MKVYWKTNAGKLACMESEGEADHREAILLAKQFLVASGEGYNEPVLAVIDGSK